MSQKLFTFFILMCFFGVLSTSNATNRHNPVKVVHNGDALRGDTGPLVYGPPAPPSYNRLPLGLPQTYNVNDVTITASEVNTSARSYYDLQSNGVINYISQEPDNPSNLHAIFMVADDQAYANRNIYYFYSTDGGLTWTYVDNISTARSGFGCLSLTSDDRAVIMAHNTDGGGINRAQMYADVAPGVGNWSKLDPGPGFDAGDIWPVVTVSSNNKALFVGSVNSTSYDTVDRNVCTNLSGTGTFLGYHNVPNGTSAQNYAVACGSGVWGIAYNGADQGAYIIQSSDDGVTWGAPTTIWSWNPVDSLGTLRSISLTYEGSNPRVMLGLVTELSDGSGFFPNAPGKEVFWGPDVNGGTPIVVDSANMQGTNPVNDVFVGCCRGVIGKAAGGGALYAAYNKTSGQFDANGNEFFDVWYRYSFDHGMTWGPKTKLTNLSGPTVDNRYVSVSPSNDGNNVYMITQLDTIPGSSVNGAALSLSRMVFIKVSGVPIGIRPISSEVPNAYALSQNFPNPFNPSTKINFNIPKSAFVSLKVYDITGKLVGNLVNQQVAAGKFQYEWNASNMPSGVYFYTLTAGDFKETKKMVLVK